MVAGSAVEVVNSPVALERMWKSSLDGQTLMPKVNGDIIAKVEVEGDGGVGSLRKYHMVHPVHGFQLMTDKVEVLDNEKHISKYSVAEGGLLGIKFKSQTTKFKFEATADGGSTVTITVEYETLGADDLDAEEKGMLLGRIAGLMKVVEAYLIANPTEYA